MIYLQETQSPELSPATKWVFLTILFGVIAYIVISRVFIYSEQIYASIYKSPFFLNLRILKDKLTPQQLELLKHEFSFYNTLNEKQKSIFRYRLGAFIKRKQFIGRDGIAPTDEMKTLISATAVMLTFGFRNYFIDIIDKIIIYPEAYYSNLNDAYHKGETNPQLQIIAFSWEDFKKGYHIGDDNLNLGIHEFGHAIHLNAFSNDDISSLIFKSGFQKLMTYLQNHQNVRQALIESKYFRTYAFTNHYEFFAVLLENFFETPIAFKSQFPEIYSLIKEMLNFKYAKY